MDSLSKALASVTQEMQCEKHGSYVAREIGFRKKFWSECPSCAEDRRAESMAASMREAAERRAQQSLANAEIPPRFMTRTFDSFVTDTDGLKKALDTVRSYADSFDSHLKAGTGLLMCGPPGTGKSHLAAAVLLKVAPNYNCRYATVSGLIRAVRDTWSRGSEFTERDLIREYGQTIDLLVLDEIGVQYGTDAERNTLFDILDRRYSYMRPTIAISNLTGEPLKAVIGERVYDRMRETQRMVVFDGASYRPRAR